MKGICLTCRSLKGQILQAEQVLRYVSLTTEQSLPKSAILRMIVSTS